LPIGHYIVDFACRSARLVVEMDGGQHANSDRDRKRDAYLEANGWRVIRIWNSDMMSNPEGVVSFIMSQATEGLGGTHPQPLPSREGRERQPRR
jgi:very-short-patch-repair endonuclease